MTVKNNVKQISNFQLIVFQAIGHMPENGDLNESLHRLVKELGENFDADRGYIFERNGPRNLANTYEWYAEGVSPEIDNLQEVGLDVYDKIWLPLFYQNKPVIIKDMKEYSNRDPVAGEILAKQKIKQLVAVPIFYEGHLYAFFGLDNPRVDDLDELAESLRPLQKVLPAALQEHNVYLSLARSSIVDHISKTYNIHFLLNRMNQIWNDPAKEQRSVIYFNISQFKLYNDSYGMEAGNILLRKVADFMKKIFQTDNITRFMGDHFVIFYEGKDEIDKITRVHDEALKQYSDFKLWLEAGVYYVNGPISYSKAWDYAKLACDHLKTGESSFYGIYTEKLKNEVELKKYLQDHVDEAIAKNYLQVYYQPVVRAVSGKVCGFEALSRWNDPHYGMISPADFVPALEEKHLSYKLYKHVIDVVTDDLAREVRNGEQVVCVSVNISRKDFDVMDTLEYMNQSVKRKGLESWMLAAEVTESAVMTDPTKVNDILGKFVKCGYEVWMDDFGSGYSNLNTLKNFRFNEIKLDMMFMRNFDERSKKVLQSLINMAKRLNIRTLAEGVETKEEFEFLRDAGCEKIQGFYFSKPRPLKDIYAWMKEKKMETSDQEESRLFKELTPLIFNQETPFSFISDHGIEQGFEIMYTSPLMINQLKKNNLKTVEDVDNLINDSTFTFARRFRKLAQMAESSHKKESMEFAIGSHFYRMQMEQVNTYISCPLLRIELKNISNQEVVESKVNAEMVSNLVNAFDAIYSYNFKTDKITVVMSTNVGERTGQTFNLNDSDVIRRIHPNDRLRLIKLFNKRTVLEKVRKTGRGKYSQLVRYRQNDGTYQWTAVSVIMNTNKDNLSCMICLTPSSFAFSSDPAHLARTIFDDTVGVSEKYLNPDELPENIITEEDLSKIVTQLPEQVLNENLNGDYRILRSIVKLFYSIGELDFEKQTSLVISAPKRVMSEMKNLTMPLQEGMDGLIKNYVKPAYKEKMKKFLDLKTLSNRLTRRNILMADYVDPVYGWSRMRITSSLRNEDGQVVKALFTIQNINEEKQHEAVIAYQACHDQLTHLLNRTGFIQTTNNLFDSPKSIGFALLDVDNFKQVNDTLGHEEGDRVLQLVASLLNKYAKPDDILVRMGGDEFVMMRLDPENGAQSIEELINKVNRQLKVASVGVPLSISAGIAVSDKGYSRVLYQHADQAMYYVKRLGGAGCRVYNEAWTIS